MEKDTLFIVNPISGNGKKKKMLAAIRKYYAHPYEIVYTRHAGEAITLARDAAQSLIVAVGGDGTVCEVAKGILSSGNPNKTLGILPCGSGDGLALHIGMSRKPKKAVMQLNEAVYTTIDFATIGGSHTCEPDMFFSVAGVGFDADVAQAFASCGKRGLWSYIRSAMKLWFSYEPLTYSLTVDGENLSEKAMMITVGNSSQWGNNAKIAPLASIRDGLLDVSLVGPFSVWRVPGLAVRLFDGHLHRSHVLKTLKGKDILIHRPCSGAAHYDGDPCIMGEDIRIRIHEAAIKIAASKEKIEDRK